MRASNRQSRPFREQLDIESAEQLFDELMSGDSGSASDPSLPQIPGYQLLHRLGEGGGGEVFFAAKEGVGRPLAVKLLRGNCAAGVTKAPNWTELDILSQLHLSCVPHVHGYGMLDTSLFIATDYIEGSNLRDHCRLRCTSRREQVTMMLKVARAVQELHERGVLHRDLKPTNILVDFHDEPVIVDFGIAELIDSRRESLSERYAIAGSPPYMAPEQARGDAGSISTRTDVYGLTATACEILTDQTPHVQAGSREEMVRHVANTPARDPQSLESSLPPPLASILKRGLSFKPEDRYSTVRELAEDLERWLEDEPVVAHPYSSWNRFRLLARRRPTHVAATVSLAVITLGLVGTAGWGMSEMQLRRDAEALAIAQEEFNDRLQAWAQQQEVDEALIQEKAANYLARSERIARRVSAALSVGEHFNAMTELYALAEEVETKHASDIDQVRLIVELWGKVLDSLPEPGNDNG